MSFSKPDMPDVKDPLPPVVSRAEEAAGISQAKERKGALSTFLSKDNAPKGGFFGDMFKKLLGE